VPNAEEQKLLDIVNQYRTQNNLPALKLDTRLQQAAHWMSEDMATNNYFDHRDSLGRDYSKRLADFGYTATPQDETILAGLQAQAAFDFWKNSATDNALLLSPQYKAMGLGYSYNASSKYKYYWVADLGGN
jgi:uncharacterized protein YkwD